MTAELLTQRRRGKPANTDDSEPSVHVGDANDSNIYAECVMAPDIGPCISSVHVEHTQAYSQEANRHDIQVCSTPTPGNGMGGDMQVYNLMQDKCAANLYRPTTSTQVLVDTSSRCHSSVNINQHDVECCGVF